MRARTLTSLDKVEFWTEQAIWDAVLNDMQVVVSTHAVLADAMSHGFVRIAQLGLIVFDEGVLRSSRVYFETLRLPPSCFLKFLGFFCDKVGKCC